MQNVLWCHVVPYNINPKNVNLVGFWTHCHGAYLVTYSIT